MHVPRNRRKFLGQKVFGRPLNLTFNDSTISMQQQRRRQPAPATSERTIMDATIMDEKGGGREGLISSIGSNG